MAATYCIGAIIGAIGVISEVKDDNNASTPENVVKLIVKDAAAFQPGAFKFINSWDVSYLSEKKADGHYRVTYQNSRCRFTIGPTASRMPISQP